MITTIIKRDGRVTSFNIDKISNAIFMAAKSMGGDDYDLACDLAKKVVDYLEGENLSSSPNVEHVQDIVEKSIYSTVLNVQECVK